MLLNYYLDHRVNRKGECPVIISVNIRKTRLVATCGFSVLPEYWNPKRQRVCAHCRNSHFQSSADINAMLAETENRFAEFERTSSGRPDRETLKMVLRGEHPARDAHAPVSRLFGEFAERESAVAQWSDGYRQIVRTFGDHLSTFARDRNLAWLAGTGSAELIGYLRNGLGLKETTVLKNYRILRRFLLWTVENGKLRPEDLPVSPLRLKILPQPVVFLNKDELISLYSLRNNGIRGWERLSVCRDLFCFCCFTSLRHSDLAELRGGSVKGNALVLVSKKTGRGLRIEINSFAKAILEKYSDGKGEEDRLFPQVSRQEMNRCLKRLGKICGFDEPVMRTFFKGGIREVEVKRKWELLGTHCGRKTFICIALSSGIPPQIVMKWTGHANYQSMKPYIDITETEKIQQMEVFEKGLRRQTVRKNVRKSPQKTDIQ